MKERVKKRVQEILQACGLTKKATAGKMSNGDWSQFQAAYKEKFKISLEEDNEIAEKEEEQISSQMQNQIISLALQLKAESSEEEEEEEEKSTKKKKAKNAESEEEEEEEKEKKKSKKSETTEEEEEEKESSKKKKKTAMTLNDAIATIAQMMPALMEKPENSASSAKVTVAGASVLGRVLGTVAHSKTYLFDIESPIFARSKWYNESIVTRQANSVIDPEQATVFSQDFRTYTSSLKARVDYLRDTNQLNQLNYEKMAAGQFNIDYGEVTIEFGKEYLVRRQDMIIAYLRTLPSVDHIFPWRSGIQDGELIPEAHFGEVSQRYQSGRVWKGDLQMPLQKATVSDVMIKYRFADMVKLEKQFVGYLNKEGSDVIKWSFIEWVLVQLYIQMQNEQNRRRVVGYLTPVQKGVDNPAMFAANGALWAIDHVEEQLRVLPHKELKTYNQATIVDYVEQFFEEVSMVLDNMDGWKLHINAKHVPWYKKGFRSKYSTDGDFTGSKLKALDYSEENFIAVPNMAKNDFRMWITLPGNIESLQDRPNEMYGVYFQRDLEELMAMARWKEGSAVNMSGIPCANEQELVETERSFQCIFTNYPVTELAEDATEIDARLNTKFLTSADNTSAVVITDIKNFNRDRVIQIICGGGDTPSKITKTGKFAAIKSDWVPKAEGDFIKLYPELEVVQKEIGGEQVEVTVPTGNWLELSRRVTE